MCYAGVKTPKPKMLNETFVCRTPESRDEWISKLTQASNQSHSGEVDHRFVDPNEILGPNGRKDNLLDS